MRSRTGVVDGGRRNHTKLFRQIATHLPNLLVIVGEHCSEGADFARAAASCCKLASLDVGGVRGIEDRHNGGIVERARGCAWL